MRRGVHIGVNMLAQQLPAGMQRGLHRFTALLGLGLMVVVAWGTAALMPEQLDELLPTLPLSVGWLLVPVFVGTVHSALHLLRIVVAGPAADAGLSAE